MDQLGATPEVIPSVYVCPVQLEMGHKEQLSNSELRLAQEQDPIIGTGEAGSGERAYTYLNEKF